MKRRILIDLLLLTAAVNLWHFVVLRARKFLATLDRLEQEALDAYWRDHQPFTNGTPW